MWVPSKVITMREPSNSTGIFIDKVALFRRRGFVDS